MRWVVVVLLVGVFATTFSVIYIRGKSREDQRVVETSDRYVPTTAAELYETYAHNGVAGDDIFLGKVVRITGTADTIQVAKGVPFVSLRSGDVRNPVVAMFDDASDEDRRALAHVEPGRDVELACVCRGLRDHAVLLRSCRVR